MQRKWFGEAVKLDSQSYLANYNFAVMSVDKVGLDRDGAIEASLRTAIRLNPAFAPVKDTRAVFFPRENRNLDVVYALETQATGSDRGNIGYRVNGSAILMAQGKFDQTLQQQLLQTGPEPAGIRAQEPNESLQGYRRLPSASSLCGQLRQDRRWTADLDRSSELAGVCERTS